MTNFETDHPRVANGTFTDKAQSAPTLTLTRYSPVNIDDNPYGTLWPTDLGDVPTPARWVDWSVGADTTQMHATAVLEINLLDLAPAGLSVDAWEAELNAKMQSVEFFFADRYDVELDEEDDWSDVKLRLDLPPLPIDTDAATVGEAVRTHTMAMKLAEDIRGNLAVQLAAWLDDSTEVQFESGSRELIGAIPPERVRDQVRSRLGETELDDNIAIAGAALLADRYGRSAVPALRRLGTNGVVKRGALSDDFNTAYNTMSAPDRDLMSMIGTWAANRDGARRGVSNAVGEGRRFRNSYLP